MIPKSESRRGIREKKQKASMIHGSNVKSASRSRIKVEVDFDKEENENPSQQDLKQEVKNESLKPYLSNRKQQSLISLIPEQKVL